MRDHVEERSKPKAHYPCPDDRPSSKSHYLIALIQRIKRQDRPLIVPEILELQSTLGNQAVGRLLENRLQRDTVIDTHEIGHDPITPFTGAIVQRDGPRSQRRRPAPSSTEHERVTPPRPQSRTRAGASRVVAAGAATQRSRPAPRVPSAEEPEGPSITASSSIEGGQNLTASGALDSTVEHRYGFEISLPLFRQRSSRSGRWQYGIFNEVSLGAGFLMPNSGGATSVGGFAAPPLVYEFALRAINAEWEAVRASWGTLQLGLGLEGSAEIEPGSLSYAVGALAPGELTFRQPGASWFLTIRGAVGLSYEAVAGGGGVHAEFSPFTWRLGLTIGGEWDL